jgi:D-galactose 1-dehydrogenase
MGDRVAIGVKSGKWDVAHSIAIIGIGKITQDQHLPVIAKNPTFRLAALVSQRGLRQSGVPTFRAPAELYAALPEVEVVAVCTPPAVRHAIAHEALDAGKHVLLEKPPAPTMAEFDDLVAHAERHRRVIFATWHSQYNAAVDEARRRLAGRKLRSLHIEWREDVRRWHPGQDWVWDAGNFGVFDPGINALSIVTKIAPEPIFIKSATLSYPANRDTPISASFIFASRAAVGPSSALTADFDWRHQSDDHWDIDIATADGERLRLSDGGAKLFVDGALAVAEPKREYEGIYEHFGQLLEAGQSAVDGAPLRLVADAFLVGRRVVVESFNW